MRKLIPSTFILLLLLLSLLGVGAWFSGIKTEENLTIFFKNKNQNIAQTFHYELLTYDRSIFHSKARVGVSLNLQNQLAHFIEDSGVIKQDTLQFDIDINHGPVLFDKSGIQLGFSAWKLVSNNLSISEETLNASQIGESHKSKRVHASIGFDDVIDYKIPFESSSGEFLMTGSFNLNSKILNGNLQSNQLSYEGENENLIVAPLNLKYQIAFETSTETEVKLFGDVKKLEYKHRFLDEKLNSNVNYQGNILIKNNILTSESRFLFNFDEVSKNQAVSAYPIKKGDLNLHIKDLNIADFKKLTTSLSKLKNLHQQSEWFLEEQGELPEGQDQIWQAQDKASQHARGLLKLVRSVFVKKKSDGDSTLNFTFQSQYHNSQSKLSGSVLPLPTYPEDYHSSISLLSLIETHAQVNLGNGWYQYLSSRLPIKKRSFKLIYKQNKLLMQ